MLAYVCTLDPILMGLLLLGWIHELRTEPTPLSE